MLLRVLPELWAIMGHHSQAAVKPAIYPPIALAASENALLARQAASRVPHT
jgi:hypothetical protein